MKTRSRQWPVTPWTKDLCLTFTHPFETWRGELNAADTIASQSTRDSLSAYYHKHDSGSNIKTTKYYYKRYIYQPSDLFILQACTLMFCKKCKGTEFMNGPANAQSSEVREQTNGVQRPDPPAWPQLGHRCPRPGSDSWARVRFPITGQVKLDRAEPHPNLRWNGVTVPLCCLPHLHAPSRRAQGTRQLPKPTIPMSGWGPESAPHKCEVMYCRPQSSTTVGAHARPAQAAAWSRNTSPMAGQPRGRHQFHTSWLCPNTPGRQLSQSGPQTASKAA